MVKCKSSVVWGMTLWVMVALSASCRIVDLRHEALRDEGTIAADSAAKGRALLAEQAEAHGTIASFRALNTATVVMTDTWYGAANRMAVMPWPRSGQRMEQAMWLGQDTSRLTLRGGRRDGQVVGIQQWCTYAVDEAGKAQLERDKDTWFWLPTLQYFLEAPFRLLEGEHIAYGGRITSQGRVYERVFITWGQVAPTMEADQYVAWIDAETRRLARLEYTVRDFFRFVRGTALYEDYREVDGLLWPHRVVLLNGDAESTSKLHVLQVESIAFGEPSAASLVPHPQCRVSKAAKGG